MSIIDAIEFYDFYVCHTHKMSHIETSIIYEHTYQFAIHGYIIHFLNTVLEK